MHQVLVCKQIVFKIPPPPPPPTLPLSLQHNKDITHLVSDDLQI